MGSRFVGIRNMAFCPSAVISDLYLFRARVQQTEAHPVLVVYLPAVRRHRERLDENARLGIPAHITVLYPFLPADAISAAHKASGR
jgi:hypothetical protein